MRMRPKPHVSTALMQLRGWVTLVAIVIVGCAFAQALTFMFANYTSVRTEDIRAERDPKAPLRVVAQQRPAAPPHAGDSTPDAGGATSADAGPAVGLDAAHEPSAPTDPRLRAPSVRASREAPDLSVGRSSWDVVMGRTSALASGIGTLACFVLCALTLLGIVVAGGGAVPGVERVVTAGVWSIVLALLCVPWVDALPSLRVPGIFASYQVMTTLIDGGTSAGATMGLFGLHFQWVAMPLVAALVAVGVCMWFRGGVERGIIITAPSELEKAIEREVTELARSGVTSGVTRTVGALNRAVGEIPATGRPAAPAASEPAGLEGAIEQAAATAGGLSREISPSLMNARGNGRGVADAGYKRLI